MAPATHTCDSHSNVTIAAPDVAESCQPDKISPYAGNNLLSMVLPATVPATTIKSEASTDNDGVNVMKEPVFIAAIILSLLILLGGFVVMRLSKLPKRKPLAGKTKPREGPPGKSLIANEVAPIPTPDYGASSPFVETVVKPGFDYGNSPGLVDMCTGSTQAFPHQLGATPQIVLSEPDDDPLDIELAVAAEVQKDRERNRLSRRDSWCRPRQGSDASASTEGTGTNHAEHVFSSASSISSITSESEMASDDEDDEEQYESADDGDQEAVFEVKRGHAQSMELMKGVLMNWPGAAESSTSIAYHHLPMDTLILTGLVGLAGVLSYTLWEFLLRPSYNPILKLAGPNPGFFKNNLSELLKFVVYIHTGEQAYVHAFGRTIRIRGMHPWEERVLSLDPASVKHILLNSTRYEKPWQSRLLISSLIGCGMLAAEGHVHKRQRKVAAPAFSSSSMNNLRPLVFKKGMELRDKWLELAAQHPQEKEITLDVCHWVSRATFDVIGVAGFDYEFHAIQNESNELFNAYKEMFEIAISQGDGLSTFISIYAPWVYKFFPSKISKTVQRCQEVIHRVAGNLIQDKKAKIEEGVKSGKPYNGRDLLTLLLKSNVSVDISPNERISDDDILNNINTFMFAGSDTSSLAVTWILYHLAAYPEVQNRLREELLSALPDTLEDMSTLTEDEVHSLYATVESLPFLENVIRESLRLVPPVHSSIRVATEDDEIPTSFPIVLKDGTVDSKQTLSVCKGDIIHVAVEGFSLDKAFWGHDAWEFNPDRWDNLPEQASKLPGLYGNTLSFSFGPRSCIGQRFSLIEIKSFIYTLVTTFEFRLTERKIVPSNVVLTRPYVSKHFHEGSQCPLLVSRYTGPRKS
ncbi:hypothetical protein EST38_g866 [Candolleomyces aberdarensis]|uniref:Cytochrome P450 n=1 Tax=Candolleomyces aberdarensis TaxID=2316362 RepID=A0A4Q2DYV6_9AGAR|nr:hypothetical protein EST38_g866 [Candolleomyces aberdarensis]